VDLSGLREQAAADAPVEKEKEMKEVWLTKGAPKWMPFHLIFFKHNDFLLLPCISYIPKNKLMFRGSEIVFGILRWRMSIYFHNGN